MGTSMAKSTDVHITHVKTHTETIAYRTPMKFGGRVVTDVILFDVKIGVEASSGARSEGRGSMPLGNVWAWPSDELSAGQTLAAMEAFAQSYADIVQEYQGSGYPLEIARDLETSHAQVAEQVRREQGLAEPMPKLAQLVAASPFDAALHDAYARLWQQNAYDVLGAEWVNQDLSAYLNEDFQGEYLDRYTLRKPKSRMPLYHLVGALDPLTEADIVQRLDDGLPETLSEWILADGLTHLKIKLGGEDLDWDVARVVGVEQVALEAQARRGCTQWHYSLDFNEKCANVQYILDFLGKVGEQAPRALERVQYIEQPTHRDLRSHMENRMHEAAKIKPVVIDESLVDFESLLLSRELGYSGVALKACKGHSEALLMGAAAQKYGLFLCVQDLTCPGASFLHSASLSARIPGVAAIEGNARQYAPQGNERWRDVYPGMFQVSDGSLRTEVLNGQGLGFDWP